MLSPRRRAQLGLLSAVAVLSAAVGALLLVPRHSRPVQIADIGTDAPDFQLDTTDGRALTLSSLRGQAVVLFFCSSDSPDAAHYTERLDHLAEQYVGDGRVAFVAVEVEPRGRFPTARLADSIDSPAFPILRDHNAAVATRYSARDLPLVVVIGPQGLVRYRGPFDNNPDVAFATHSFAADALRDVLDTSTIAVAASPK